MYNYSRLRGRIVEKLGSQQALSKSIGVSMRSISLKMNHKREFTQDDMVKICRALDLNLAEIPNYFFVENAQKVEH